MVSLQSWLFFNHLLVSGIVVVDITDGQLVLILALLDIVLTLGHLVLQLPHLKTPAISKEGRGEGTPTPLTTNTVSCKCI